MSRKFFVISVIAAMFLVAVVASCEKEAERLLEVVKNENGEHKVEYDDQNRIAKLLWYDKKDGVFKKTTFSYSDDLIKLKIENISNEEYVATGSYTTLDGNIILKGAKKIVVEY